MDTEKPVTLYSINLYGELIQEIMWVLLSWLSSHFFAIIIVRAVGTGWFKNSCEAIIRQFYYNLRWTEDEINENVKDSVLSDRTAVE